MMIAEESPFGMLTMKEGWYGRSVGMSNRSVVATRTTRGAVTLEGGGYDDYEQPEGGCHGNDLKNGCRERED